MLMFRQKVRQNDLGRALHLNQSGVARRLRGETSWRSTDLVAAAALLDTTVAYLVGEVDDDPKSRPADYKSVGLSTNRRTFPEDHLGELIDIECAFELRERAGELVPA